jgi:DNA replication protein DnaC
VSTAPPPLAADLNDGLKRLKMAAMRRLAPELLITAKTQRWNPEEFLRTLVEAEITARDESNARTRMRQAAFPVRKTIEEFDFDHARAVKRDTIMHLGTLDFVTAKDNVVFLGPAGTE